MLSDETAPNRDATKDPQPGDTFLHFGWHAGTVTVKRRRGTDVWIQSECAKHPRRESLAYFQRMAETAEVIYYAE